MWCEIWRKGIVDGVGPKGGTTYVLMLASSSVDRRGVDHAGQSASVRGGDGEKDGSSLLPESTSSVSRPYLAALLRRTTVNKNTRSRRGLPEGEKTSLLACRAISAAFGPSKSVRIGCLRIRPFALSFVRPFSEETFVVRENNPSLSRQPAQRRWAAAPSNSKYGCIACPSPLAGRCTYRLHRSAVRWSYLSDSVPSNFH